MKKPAAVTEVIHMERVLKGGRPTMFKGPGLGIPGDSLFADVKVQGERFAVSVVAMGGSGITPEQFELALRSAVAALNEMCERDQEPGVEVVQDTSVN